MFGDKLEGETDEVWALQVYYTFLWRMEPVITIPVKDKTKI